MWTAGSSGRCDLLGVKLSDARAFDGDRGAAVAKAIEERLDHGLVLQEVVPAPEVHVGRDDGCLPPGVALVHQPEEEVCLFGLQDQVAHFVDEQQVVAGEPVQAVA